MLCLTSNRGGGHSVRKRCRTAFSYWVGVIALDHNPLDFIEAHLIAPAIVELGRARRGVVRHRRGLFERAAVLEIDGDPCRSEVWLPSLVAMPAAAARRRIIAYAFAYGSTVRVRLAVPRPPSCSTFQTKLERSALRPTETLVKARRMSRDTVVKL